MTSVRLMPGLVAFSEASCQINHLRCQTGRLLFALLAQLGALSTHYLSPASSWANDPDTYFARRKLAKTLHRWLQRKTQLSRPYTFIDVHKNHALYRVLSEFNHLRQSISCCLCPSLPSQRQIMTLKRWSQARIAEMTLKYCSRSSAVTSFSMIIMSY